MTSTDFKLILGCAAEGFCDWDLKSDSAFLSPRYCELIGYPSEEIVLNSQSFRTIIHPDDHCHVFESMKEFQQGKCDRSPIEYRMISKDGIIKWIESRWKIVEIDKEGLPVRMVETIIDISERKKSEEYLKESEELFRTIVENSPNMVMIHVDGKFVYLNPAAVEKFGIENRHEYIGESIIDVVHPDFRNSFSKKVGKISAPDQLDINAEKRLLKKDGSSFWVEIYESPSIYRGNKAVQIIAVDITRRKLLEEELRYANEEWQRSFDTIPDMITIVDNEHRIVRANRAAWQKLGGSIHDLVGKPCYTVFHGLDSPPESCPHTQLVHDGLAHSEEVVEPRSGSCLDVTVTPLRDIYGVLTGSIHVAHDITRVKLAGEAMRQSEYLFRSIFENSPVAIGFGMTEDGMLADVNNAWLQMFGYERNEVIGRSSTELNLYVDSGEQSEIFRIVREHGRIVNRELLQRRKSGEIITVQYSAELINLAGESFLQVLMTDITEKKRIETEHFKNEKMYQSLFENMLNGFAYCQIIYDGDTPVDFVYLSVNKAFEKQTGLKDVIGRHVSEVIPGIRDTDPGLFEVYNRVATTGNPEQLETYVEALDNWFWISVYSPAREYFVAVFDVITDRKRAEDELRFRNIILSTQQEASLDGILVVDEKSRILSYNRRFVEMWDIRKELIEQRTDEQLLNLVVDKLVDSRAFLLRVQYLYEHRQEISQDELLLADGRIFDRYSAPMIGSGDRYLGRVWYFRDITIRKQTELLGEMSREVLQILNEPSAMQDSLQRVFAVLKARSGFDAVSIRLQDGDDFPYFIQKGFSEDFLLTENTLIEHSDDGDKCYDIDGNVSLGCTCGLVISGNTDRTSPFFTAGGSFWTNDSFQLQGLPPDEDPRFHPRNHCMHEGFASMALVPIRNNDRIVGLIQFNDKRKGYFSLHTVELLEGIASHIGEAILRKKTEEELKEKDAEIEHQHAELCRKNSFIEKLVMRSGAPQFVLGQDHRILFWNQALAELTGLKSEDMQGSDRHWQPFYPEKRPTMADLVMDNDEKSIPELYEKYRKSKLVEGAMQSEGWFRFPGHGRRYLFFHASPITDTDGRVVAVVETLEDLTEAKQIETVLNEQYHFLQQVLDSLPAPVFYTNRHGAYIGCNRSFEEFFGRNQHDIMGKHITDLNPAEFSQIHSDCNKVCMKSDSIQTYESSLLHADGSIRQIITTKAPLHLSSGKVNGLVGAFTDITERKLTEIALRESEEKFRTINDSAQDAIIMIDSSGRVTSWNAAAERIFGYGRNEILGRHLLEYILSPAVPDLFMDAFTGIRENGQASAAGRTLEITAIHKDGQEIPIELSLSTVCLEGQWCATVLARDITTRKEAQEAIAAGQAALEAKHDELQQVFTLVEASKLEWEQTLDSIKDIIILTDSHHHIRRCNRMLIDITGKSFEDLVHRDWREILSESGFNFDTFDGTEGELLHERTQHQFDLNIYEIRDPGCETPQALVISLNNITEIKEMTGKLEEAHAVLKSTQVQVVQQEKMASIGLMAAGVAHEINNPMAFISCNMNSLGKYIARLREYKEALTPYLAACSDSSRQAIEEIQRTLKIDYILEDTGNLVKESQEGIDRVRRIVQNLKSFSRIDRADEEVADIVQCLESTINIAWNEIKYVAVLRKEFEDIPPLKCFPQQLNQVFLNLLVNAAHSISDQGEIIVRTWHDADNIFVSVSDTGSGIPEEIQQRIFEPFFTTKEAGKGTGLGLSISIDIVRKHGGELMLTSQLGRGTTFTVRLPINNVHV